MFPLIPPILRFDSRLSDNLNIFAPRSAYVFEVMSGKAFLVRALSGSLFGPPLIKIYSFVAGTAYDEEIL